MLNTGLEGVGMEPTTLLTLVLAAVLAVLVILLIRQRVRESAGRASVTRLPSVDEQRLARLERDVEQIRRHLGLQGTNPPRQGTNAPDDVVRNLLQAGKKIDAIRAYRAATGVGLKEAKDAVEALERFLPKS